MNKALKSKAAEMFGAASNSPGKGSPLGKGGSSPKKNKEQKKAAASSTVKEKDDQFEAQKTKLRKIWGGGLYAKPNGGNSEEAVEEDNKYYWNRVPLQPTGDFLTLIRRTVAVVLAQQGFIMREIFVNEGKEIAMVICFPEQNLHKYAMSIKMPRTPEFGVIDLLSLEPVDSKGRPLRFNQILFDEGGWERKYVQEYFTFLDDLNPLKTDGKKRTAEAERIIKLRQQIVELLDSDCNFTKISRLCQFIQWDLMDEEVNVAGQILSPEYVPIQLWEEFYT